MLKRIIRKWKRGTIKRETLVGERRKLKKLFKSKQWEKKVGKGRGRVKKTEE